MTKGTRSGTPLDVSLGGDLLIDASAGTGKTYALTTLVARLIVEENRRIDQLLIVTFSNAAAGELRDRVWRTLQEARGAIAAPGTSASHQARQLVERWRDHVIQRDALARLEGAIRDFDLGNITTIHGFCQRALSEFALQADIPFSFEVSGDDTLAVAAATKDFWRKHMVDAPIGLLDYAKSNKFVLDEDTTAWAGAHRAGRHVIRGAGPAGTFERELQAKRRNWSDETRSVRRSWNDAVQRERFLSFTRTGRWLSGKRDPRRTRTLAEALDADALDRLAPDYATFFGRDELDGKLFKNESPPPDRLYDEFARLGETGREYGSYWLADRRRQLLADVRETLHHSAWEYRTLNFEDLLTELHRALYSDAGATLARRIRERYPIALVDEFQDTDRQQAQIFECIYEAGEEPALGRLFVVGDPKQSIYRFRGADVFAYFDARRRIRQSGQDVTLERNYRSTPRLVQAVNTLFGQSAPFLLEQPEFEPSRAALKNDSGASPFRIDIFPCDDRKKPAKSKMNELATQHAASEIARLLDPANGEPAFAAGDIAVLVRSGKQGKAVAAALRYGYAIDSVEMGTDNVLESTEAADLQRLLQTLAGDVDYDATARLRGALAAPLFGLNMHELADLRDNDAAWSRWRERAVRWMETWQERGVAALMRHLLFASEADCAANLLRYPDGPRRLTNFLHLTDLLHDAEISHRPSRHGLIDWFTQSRAESRIGQETAQLRLESDENLVKIVTIHRAKGLEFPAVFCPFAWDGRRPKAGKLRNPTTHHYDHANGNPVLDLNPSDAAYDDERVEEHADELRLLYVALTRAKTRCTLTWAQANESEHAPLAWLLHGRSVTDDDTPIGRLKKTAAHVKKLGADELVAEVRQLASRAPRAISVREIDPALPALSDKPLPDRAVPLKHLDLGRKLGAIRQRTSYSAMSTEAGAARSAADHDEVERPDHDPDDPFAAEEIVTAEQPAEEEDLSVFTFPSGSRPGKCLHEIFEKRLRADAEHDSICRDALTRYRIDLKWEQVAHGIVEDTLRTPLARPGEEWSVFSLADIERPLVEMEFHLPVENLRRSELARGLADHGYGHALPDSQAGIHGFLHGFIDVVARQDGRWYIMDYKSNWLGPDLSAYSPAGLKQAMDYHAYHLQYLLYITALHRLLRLRLPDYDYDRHIGGAFYLFVRGMRPGSPGSGVYRHRPSRTVIETVNACLGGQQ